MNLTMPANRRLRNSQCRLITNYENRNGEKTVFREINTKQSEILREIGVQLFPPGQRPGICPGSRAGTRPPAAGAKWELTYACAA